MEIIGKGRYFFVQVADLKWLDLVTKAGACDLSLLNSARRSTGAEWAQYAAGGGVTKAWINAVDKTEVFRNEEGQFLNHARARVARCRLRVRGRGKYPDGPE